MRSLPAEEKEAIAQIFNSIDTDMSGSISPPELAALLEDTYGMRPTRAELAKLRAEVDSGGDGFITLEEFTKAMGTVAVLQKAGDMFKWKQMFLDADEDKSGVSPACRRRHLPQPFLPPAPQNIFLTDHIACRNRSCLTLTRCARCWTACGRATASSWSC